VVAVAVGVVADRIRGQKMKTLFQIIVAAALALAGTAFAAPSVATFKTPEAGADALLMAAIARDSKAFVPLFGADTPKIIAAKDQATLNEGIDKFLRAWGRGNKVVKEGDSRAVIEVGGDGFQFPVPLVRRGNAWVFDTRAGIEEIGARRIGRNELTTIETLRAVVDAQQEFAVANRGSGSVFEYSRRFASTSGKRDGLYWKTGPGEPQSPLGELFERAIAEGVKKGEGWHGYRYRILTRQGASAPGGARNYDVKGRLSDFAVLAWPVKYGETGVKTFITNSRGEVWSIDLGRNTAAEAQMITAFDPGTGWTKEQ
jgi:hypothetical protein